LWIVANRIIESLRNRIPYIRRLHSQIDELQHRLATVEAAPEPSAAIGADSAKIATQFREFLRHLQPHDVPGFCKRRFGALRDGGYVMLDDFAPARHALSLGVGPEVSWDIDIAARGLRVFQYDHTVAGGPVSSPNLVFHRNRVVGRPEGPQDVTLAQILAQPELAADRDVIAKIDIEEAEWELLAQTDQASLQRIRQLVVELGEVRRFVDLKWRTIMLAALRNLAATHACIHVHGNNWGPFAVVGGIPFPNWFEVTFVRRGDHAIVPCAEIFPSALDRPNNPKRPDLHIGSWDY
jgi:hypothetical protein